MLEATFKKHRRERLRKLEKLLRRYRAEIDRQKPKKSLRFLFWKVIPEYLRFERDFTGTYLLDVLANLSGSSTGLKFFRSKFHVFCRETPDDTDDRLLGYRDSLRDCWSDVLKRRRFIKKLWADTGKIPLYPPVDPRLFSHPPTGISIYFDFGMASKIARTLIETPIERFKRCNQCHGYFVGRTRDEDEKTCWKERCQLARRAENSRHSYHGETKRRRKPLVN